MFGEGGNFGGSAGLIVGGAGLIGSSKVGQAKVGKLGVETRRRCRNDVQYKVTDWACRLSFVDEDHCTLDYLMQVYELDISSFAHSSPPVQASSHLSC